MTEQLQPFLISFLIGLFIGIDRERSLPKGTKGMGVRSFCLIALMGTTTAVLNQLPHTILITGLIVGMILRYQYFTPNVKPKSTSLEFATGLSAALVYLLGYLSPTNPALASVIGMTTLVTLVGRERLHTFAKEKLHPDEITAAATMVVILICVLVLIPDRLIDPWHLFNPRRFGMLVAIIATMQFVGYVAIRVFGNQLGMGLMGFFGGLVSSTAVFAMLPGFVKQHPTYLRSASATAILSTIATLIEFSLVVLIAAPELFFMIIRPVAAMIIMGSFLAITLYRNENHSSAIEPPKNPLDITSVLIMSFVIGGMIFLVALTKMFLGTQAVKMVSFLGGFFELHGVSFATAMLFHSAKLNLNDAASALYLALLSSYLSKFVLLFGFARNRFGILTFSCLVLMMIAGGVFVVF